jgi:uncharacterized protein YyaL (SSP411 family)
MTAFIFGILFACGIRSPAAESANPSADTYVSASVDALVGPWTNRLDAATSPYLKMHGHDPVNWYPWGDAAFAEAERRGVPVFLSIGYYACHWCHVMHRESFKDPAVAAYLNDNFVAIKVDREERPDIDALYMDAVHMLNGNNGGWPASIWMTPERVPFFAGTYFPPKGRYGRPGFKELLERITRDWRTKPIEIAAFASRTGERMIARASSKGGGLIPSGLSDKAAAQLLGSWSPEHRGWGARRQFPMSANLQFMLWHSVNHADKAAGALVTAQLTAMDEGGIHDHLGGGFHRYTVDADWLVPHFEKMLYDNGQLLAVYAEAAVAQSNPRFAQVAQDIGDYLISKMQHKRGAFYSSESADSEGEEGTFYVWTPEQIKSIVSDFSVFNLAFPVTDSGNFEGRRTVLTRVAGVDPERTDLASDRALLFAARDTREHPPTDDKLVVAWNGLAIGGLSRTGRLLDLPRFIVAAQEAANHVLSVVDQGRVPRLVAQNAPMGVLEDYAFLGNGLMDLYEADPNPRWLLAAAAIANTMLERFYDASTGALYQADKSVTLLVRKTDLTDGAEPSGPGRALRLLSRLRALGAPVANTAVLDKALSHASWIFRRSPSSAVSLVSVADRVSRKSTELVIATDDLKDPKVVAMLGVFNQTVRPHTVLSVLTPQAAQKLSAFVGLLGKTPGTSGPRAFVCHDGVCHLPTDDLVSLKAQLDG